MTFMLRAWLLMVTEEPRSTSKPESVSVSTRHIPSSGRKPLGWWHIAKELVWPVPGLSTGCPSLVPAITLRYVKPPVYEERVCGFGEAHWIKASTSQTKGKPN